MSEGKVYSGGLRAVGAKATVKTELEGELATDLLHCVVLSNGQVGFFPQHKLLLADTTFKPYKKLHTEWAV